MSSQEPDIEVEDLDASPRWHLKALAVIAALLLAAYVAAVNLVLK